VNLLWGTEYEHASEWVQGKTGRPRPYRTS
jgi:hypothetical protein